jgi:dienelactone hydrolase
MTPERRRSTPLGQAILLLIGLAAASALLLACGRKDDAPTQSCSDVVYQSNGGTVPARLCRPDGPPTERPAVLYLHAVGGPGEVPQEIFRHLTTAGLVVLAPSYFAQTPAPGPDPHSFAHAYATGEDAAYTAAAQQWPRIIGDGVTFLQQQPGVATDRIGITGYSLGGALALYVAAADERLRVAAPIAAFVELDGFPRLSRFFGGFSDRTAHLPPLLLVHGNRDGHAPVAQAYMIAAATKAAGGSAELAIYDGDHSLRGKQNEWAAQRLTEFLRLHLESGQALRAPRTP